MSLYNILIPYSQQSNVSILSVIDDILSFAQSLWIQAKQPPESSRPVLEYNHDQLMGGNSLIHVYMCIALAKSFLNYDVLRYIVPVDQSWDSAALDQDFMGVNARNIRVSRMPDETMHRLFLPLTCAMTLCDSIRPQRLAFQVAEYMADIVPLLSTSESLFH